MTTFLAKPAEYHTKYIEFMLAKVDVDLDLKYKTVIDEFLLQAKGSSEVGVMVVSIMTFSCGFTFVLLILGLVNVFLIANYFERFCRKRSNQYTNVPLVEIMALTVEQNDVEG